MSFTNQHREYPVGAQFIGASPIYRPGEGIDGPLADNECCQPNGVIIPIGTLAAQPPAEWCRPNRGRCVLPPVGTRGAVGWMSGPCAQYCSNKKKGGRNPGEGPYLTY